jgi:hypothetical protein
MHAIATTPAEPLVLKRETAPRCYIDYTLEKRSKSYVVNYALLHPDAMTAALGYDVDFAVAGLVGNRISIGNYINRVQAAGSSAALSDTITKLVPQTQLEPYSDLLTQLGTEAYAEQQADTLDDVHRFSGSCRTAGHSISDASSVTNRAATGHAWTSAPFLATASRGSRARKKPSVTTHRAFSTPEQVAGRMASDSTSTTATRTRSATAGGPRRRPSSWACSGAARSATPQPAPC